jgi:cell division control protein 6
LLSPSSESSGPATRGRKRAADFVIAADDEPNPFLGTRPKRRCVTLSKPARADHLDELSLENSPPAQRLQEKRQLDSAPTTPRHRDAVSKVVITPRHRTGLPARVLTPYTIRTPGTPRTAGPSVYNEARKAFRSSLQTGAIIGRDTERAELQAFVEKRLQAKSSGCIYVSGPPGTGKTALVSQITDALKDWPALESSYCNCMSIKTARDVFSKLFDDFGVTDALEGTEMTRLKKTFHLRNKPYLVVLDEIDGLLDVDLELLYQLFEWSLHKSSSLVLIGIANALDLTDRFLPRLKSKSVKPHLVPFLPYSATEISSIITSKLTGLLPADHSAPDGFVPFMQPTAVQFVCRKVSTQTGDIRKAFAIVLRALDLIESETLASLTTTLTPQATPSPARTPLGENGYLSSPPTNRSPRRPAPAPQNPLAALTAETAPRATIAHVARVTTAAFSNGLAQRVKFLTLQQKAAVCALCALESRRRADAARPGAAPKRGAGSTSPTLRALWDAYSGLCKQDEGIAPLSMSEFGDVVGGLEALSLVAWVDGKNGSLGANDTPSRRRAAGLGGNMVEGKKVASCIAVTELKEALKGPGSRILLGILDGHVF